MCCDLHQMTNPCVSVSLSLNDDRHSNSSEVVSCKDWAPIKHWLPSAWVGPTFRQQYNHRQVQKPPRNFVASCVKQHWCHSSIRMQWCNTRTCRCLARTSLHECWPLWRLLLFCSLMSDLTWIISNPGSSLVLPFRYWAMHCHWTECSRLINTRHQDTSSLWHELGSLSVPIRIQCDLEQGGVQKGLIS